MLASKCAIADAPSYSWMPLIERGFLRCYLLKPEHLQYLEELHQ